MISLGLVFFGFGTKDSPLLRTSIAAFVSILLLRLTSDFLLYASGLIAGIYISSDGTCRMSSRSVLFSLVSPVPNVK